MSCERVKTSRLFELHPDLRLSLFLDLGSPLHYVFEQRPNGDRNLLALQDTFFLLTLLSLSTLHEIKSLDVLPQKQRNFNMWGSQSS